MASIKLVAIEKWFDDTQVIKGIDLQISEGEFIVPWSVLLVVENPLCCEC